MGDDDAEVSFQDFNNDALRKTKKGFGKILAMCDQAKKDGIDWGWVDTCCIDKSSSAELTESINSMFKWYRDSKVCYAYLGDATAMEKGWKRNEWFTRGWTLQELIAPPVLNFIIATVLNGTSLDPSTVLLLI